MWRIIEFVVQLDGAFGESFEPSIEWTTSRADCGEVVLEGLVPVLVVLGEVVYVVVFDCMLDE